ncbi:hypothetical protein B0H14DRAFT_2737504 [Mycena olivaceomarginata]|nr:hypothetical protein B0H14DRAFT_2737504 [Mycena olivaceomarginata]
MPTALCAPDNAAPRVATKVGTRKVSPVPLCRVALQLKAREVTGWMWYPISKKRNTRQNTPSTHLTASRHDANARTPFANPTHDTSLPHLARVQCNCQRVFGDCLVQILECGVHAMLPPDSSQCVSQVKNLSLTCYDSKVNELPISIRLRTTRRLSVARLHSTPERSHLDPQLLLRATPHPARTLSQRGAQYLVYSALQRRRAPVSRSQGWSAFPRMLDTSPPFLFVVACLPAPCWELGVGHRQRCNDVGPPRTA